MNRTGSHAEPERIAIDEVRATANGALQPERKAELGQFMTPTNVARFMATLFTEDRGPVRLLDAGAGVGSLTAAFLERFGTEGAHVTAYEIDATMRAYLRDTLAHYENNGCEGSVIDRDFIQEAVYDIKLARRRTGFTHAILNPPYKKIHSGSAHRALLRAVGLETVNLYSAFVGLAIELMEGGGEVVAIIPRSFCNGLYYKPFRAWLLAHASLDHIHLFHSRTSAFSDDAVLQENVIIRLVRGKRQGQVTITTSNDTSFSDIHSHVYPFSKIVHSHDPQMFIHVPTDPAHIGLSGVPLATYTLEQIGLAVSTGPVVDFRLKEFLLREPMRGAAPLLYPAHFAGGRLQWPRQFKKPNALLERPETRKWLFPNGFYTVVRRFSSKEERRRVIAHVVDPSAFTTDVLAFENHLNVFHADKHGIDCEVAHGLSIFLNSTAVDEYFRRFSGHTQVNATDLRLLLYPGISELRELGRWSLKIERLSQELMDEQVMKLHGHRKQGR